MPYLGGQSAESLVARGTADPSAFGAESRNRQRFACSLERHQLKTVSVISELIIPQTSTLVPARQGGLFIDLLLPT